MSPNFYQDFFYLYFELYCSPIFLLDDGSDELAPFQFCSNRKDLKVFKKIFSRNDFLEIACAQCPYGKSQVPCEDGGAGVL